MSRVTRWARIQQVLDRLGEVAPRDLSRRLDELCGDDPDLRAEVESLLESDDDGVAFVSSIVREASARVLSDEDPLVGERVGSYRVLERLGEGGMSTVYRAHRDDDRFEQTVCLKVLKRGLDTDALLRRFDIERRILASLNHPLIARLYDGASTPDGRPYFVMELIEGEPIDRYCRERRLSIRDRLRLIRSVCEAVQYAHQRLIVHRDLKPANILVTADGTPKLLDFGIAKLLGEGGGEAEVTGNTVAFFTPEYASPEQIRGERVTTATDEYSLGVLLYLVLTGRRPYEVAGQSRAAIERAVCEARPERPSRLIRRLSVDLDHIVARAMRVDPEGRYGSVQDLSEDIARHLRGEPVRARKGTRVYRMGRFLRRNRTAAVFVGLLVIFAGAMMAQSIRLERASVRSESVARHLAEMATVSDTDISFLEAPSSPALQVGTGSLSLSAWIRLRGPEPGTVSLMDKRVPPYTRSRGFQLFLYDNRLGVQLSDGVRISFDGRPPLSGGNYLGASSLADRRWHHVVATVARGEPDAGGRQITLYVDGVVDAVHRKHVRAGDLSNDAPLRIGVQSDGFSIAKPFVGSIQRPRVYRRALEPGEVAELYDQGRRTLRSVRVELPERAAASRAPVPVAFTVRNRSRDPVTCTWSVAGIPGRDGEVPLSRFTPASGTTVLPAGPSHVEVPLIIDIDPDGIGRGPRRYRVTLVDIATMESLTRVGTIVDSLGAPEWDGDLGTTPAAVDDAEDLVGGVETEPMIDDSVPLDFRVRVRPNGFVTDPSIQFDLGNQPSRIRMEVVDLTGRVIRHIDLGVLRAGLHSVAWDGLDDAGRRVRGGYYAIDVLGRRKIARFDESTGRFQHVEQRGPLRTKVVYLP